MKLRTRIWRLLSPTTYRLANEVLFYRTLSEGLSGTRDPVDALCHMAICAQLARRLGDEKLMRAMAPVRTHSITIGISNTLH